MSQNESDAEYERRYPQKRSGMPVWAILLVVFGATGFVGCIGVVGLAVFGLLFGAAAAVPAAPPPMATAEPPKLQERFSRAEFEPAVMGKTAADVKTTLGEPTISVGADGEETWMYRRRTTDPVSGRVDDMTYVVFKGGQVVRVDYHNATGPGGPGGPGPATGK